MDDNGRQELTDILTDTRTKLYNWRDDHIHGTIASGIVMSLVAVINEGLHWMAPEHLDPPTGNGCIG